MLIFLPVKPVRVEEGEEGGSDLERMIERGRKWLGLHWEREEGIGGR